MKSWEIFCLISLILLIIKSSICQRRIVDGKTVVNDKPYMVYLVKAPESPVQHDAWLCGGAIIHPNFVLTSAACLTDVQYMYAIAGYNKYVNADKIEEDECTKRTKKRVIAYCLHYRYYLKQDDLSWWTWVDIAVAKVETPYDFYDQTYKQYCSYIPNKITINFLSDNVAHGKEAMVLGWGHRKYFRPENDTNDYNEEFLQYASTIIMDSSHCKPYYSQYSSSLGRLLSDYVFCSYYKGNMNDEGKVFMPITELVNGCSDRNTLKGTTHKCDEVYGLYDTRRMISPRRDGNVIGNTTSAICQNDHGSPIITWMGGHEIVIGVATMFMVNKKMECVGPAIYTSTYCLGAFLNCILKSENYRRTDKYCNAPGKVKGFEIIETEINWEHYDDRSPQNDTAIDGLEGYDYK